MDLAGIRWCWICCFIILVPFLWNSLRNYFVNFINQIILMVRSRYVYVVLSSWFKLRVRIDRLSSV
jgi:hypothetical protein